MRYQRGDVFELYKVNNQDIVDIINDYQLNTPCRKQEMNYKRYYLFDYLYKYRNMPLTLIGEFFNRDHSSVLHGIRQHKQWYTMKDDRYLKYIYPLPELIKAKRDDITIFDVNVMPLCDEEAKITLIGNLSNKFLTKFDETMTVTEICDIFEAIRVNTEERA
jgi:hypothetical protein